MADTPQKNVTIYTDGACSGNPGPGGYGVVLIYKSWRKELSAGYRWTTNNRMELLALIKAVEQLKEPCALGIYSDSKYVIQGFTKGWVAGWRKNGWKTASKNPVQNRDLWERLDSLLEGHTYNFTWVKGHAENKENNRCDALAVAACKKGSLAVDEGFEVERPFEGS